MVEKERYYKLSLLKSLAYDDDVNGNRDGMIDFTVIDSIGGADVEKVRHGEWIKAPYSEKCGDSYCSECNHFDWSDCKYCSNCGAKMDGGNK